VYTKSNGAQRFIEDHRSHERQGRFYKGETKVLHEEKHLKQRAKGKSHVPVVLKEE